MPFTYGRTRFVLLIGPYAIKLARFLSPFSAVRGLARHTIAGDAVAALKEHHPTSKLYAAMNYLAPGIVANRRENRCYKEHPEIPLAPVHALLFGGLFLIQARGRPATLEEIETWRPLLLLRAGAVVDCDLVARDHLCIVGKTLCIVDVGKEASLQELIAAFAQ